MSADATKKKPSKEERIAEENRKRLKIVADEMKDIHFFSIQEDVKQYFKEAELLETFRQKILSRIQNFKDTRGYFIPTEFSYTGGHMKLDSKRAVELAEREGIPIPQKEIVQHRLDEKQLESDLRAAGLVVPYTTTKSSFFPLKTKNHEGDE